MPDDSSWRQQSTVKCSFVIHALLAFFVIFFSTLSKAQSPNTDGTSPDLVVDSTFVWVPALVRNQAGETLSTPAVGQLRLFDNGARQKVTEVNMEKLPISLVVLMQTGGSASRFLPAYTNLPELINQWVGDAFHEIMLVTFDSRVEQIWHFPARIDGVDYAIRHQHPGDQGAAIKDAAFGVRQLEDEPGRFRRIVLLLSQGRDSGSSISSQSLLKQLGTSNTVVYSLTFPGEKSHLARVREKTPTGPAEKALTRTNRALDARTAEEVAYLTGGAHFQFDDQRSQNSAILGTVSDFHNGITLGFQPSHPEVGFHRIEIQADSPELRVTARRAYWWARPD